MLECVPTHEHGAGRTDDAPTTRTLELDATAGQIVAVALDRAPR